MAPLAQPRPATLPLSDLPILVPGPLRVPAPPPALPPASPLSPPLGDAILNAAGVYSTFL